MRSHRPTTLLVGLVFGTITLSIFSKDCFCTNNGVKDVLLGAPGGDLQPSEKVKKLVSDVKPQFQLLVGEKFDELQPISYRLQIVAGNIYLVRVESRLHLDHPNLDQAHYIARFHHLKIYQVWGQAPILKDYKKDVKPSDPLEYF